MNNELSKTESLDFHYLLSLMRPLYKTEEYEWLPEMFSIIGAESLIDLCKYAGGEYIKIPTIDELDNALHALQWFYNVEIAHASLISDVPKALLPLFKKIQKVYSDEC